MLESRIIEIDGIFLGAAVALRGMEGWRFVSAHCRAQGLNGRIAPSLEAVRRLARQAYLGLPAKLQPAEISGGRNLSRETALAATHEAPGDLRNQA